MKSENEKYNSNDNYPAIYKAADKLSNKYQKWYLWSIRVFLGLIVILALQGIKIKIINNVPEDFTLIIVGLLIIVTFIIAFWDLNKVWYSARALAESIKTISWRFMTKAEPYKEKLSVKEEFIKDIRQIINQNHTIVEKMGHYALDEDQITEKMQQIRNSSLSERIEYYKNARIENQLAWYKKRTKSFNLIANIWFVILIAILGVSFFVLIINNSRVLITNVVPQLLPALVGSILTWIQTKKYKEVAAAYTQTAHEIGFLKTKISEIEEEEQFSKFVSDAENAFSREHTQWAARRDQ